MSHSFMKTSSTCRSRIVASLTAALAIVCFSSQQCQGALMAAGDIAFVGHDTAPDAFSFVPLVDIGGGQTIFFTDKEFVSGAFNSGEGEVSWTTAVDVMAGTVITISNPNDTASDPIGTSTGTAVETVDGFTVATTDNIYAYLGTSLAPSTFLTALDNGGTNFSLAGTGLTAGTNALDLSGITDPADREYTGDRMSQPTFSSYRALINNPANWGTFTSFNTTPISTQAVPEPNAFVLLAVVLVGIGARRRMALQD